jgi:hypothetical protein
VDAWTHSDPLLFVLLQFVIGTLRSFVRGGVTAAHIGLWKISPTDTHRTRRLSEVRMYTNVAYGQPTHDTRTMFEIAFFA